MRARPRCKMPSGVAKGVAFAQDNERKLCKAWHAAFSWQQEIADWSIGLRRLPMIPSA